MKGDFSRVRYAPNDNFNGILPQQGKVLLDSDGIAQTLIENNWHETAARDIVGRLAGVPAAVPGSFEISAASLADGVVTLTVGTGHLWADGLLVRLESEAGNTVTRIATWLEPPLVMTEGNASDVAVGTMDAVVLEVWQHAVNGYEMPNTLIEPALGGPDTAERLQTSYAFRLARLTEGQSCADLMYDEKSRGSLTASLVPPVTTSGDCPVDGSGGYSGFEHQLYRIEIADINGGASQFKWSRTNGGLVGRGIFDPATQSFSITANMAAITSANQASFYLEIESYDDALGYSRVITGAQAKLSGGSLQCTAAPTFGAYPSASGSFFFRLWDGIAPVSSYPISATPVQLESGILLQFEADGVGKYFPGDYWMFPVRAQGIANPQTLINAKKPEGINYYHVPLAEITWASAGGSNYTAGTIEDCRTIVQPLSQVKGCCTCRVGDGVESFGEFTSIQAAVDSLPAEGGEVCILPGHYFENVWIAGRQDIVIHGCGWQTRVASHSLLPVNPKVGVTTGARNERATFASNGPNNFAAVFTVIASQHIELRSFAVETADDEVGILIDGIDTPSVIEKNSSSIGLKDAALGAEASRASVQLRGVIDVTIEEMVLTAATLPAILAEQVQLLRIERNRVVMKNVQSLWPAVFVSGSEIHIEKNWVGIQTATTIREWLPATVVGDLKSEAAAELNNTKVGVAAEAIVVTSVLHPGGIQIGGPSRDVYVLENEIEGGSRNGITLGSFAVLDANGTDTGVWIGVVLTGESDDCCTGTLQPPTNPTGGDGGTLVSGGTLHNIQIHRNRIRSMGLCGIGPVGFFDLQETLEIISIVGLNITANSISRTVLRPLTAIKEEAVTVIGYGAICIPDVQDLTICDNTITDFGARPGLHVCGVFVLHGEIIEISRNQIVETRDWSDAVTDADTSTSGPRGGILVVMGTPPSFPQPLDSSLWSNTDQSHAAVSNATSTPIYEPGLPAVRVEHNVVRVPLGYALAIAGLGPFSIVNNHLGCGGLVRSSGTQIAQTVLIVNLGAAIEVASAANLPSNAFFGASVGTQGATTAGLREVSNGSVLFTNNICQLEATASRQLEVASVAILTSDHLIFSNNVCWLDALRFSAVADALLVAGSLNVVGNRFQESLNSVLLSGLTVGRLNVTGQNISTYCLLALGAMQSNNNNLALVQAGNSELCAEFNKDLQGALGL